MRLHVANAKKTYGKKNVLCDISIDVPDGAWLSIIGSSGCGKSTLLNVVAGILEPESGIVCVGDTTRSDQRSSLVGYLLQDFPLYPSLKVRDNLEFAIRRQAGHSGPTLDEIVQELQIEGILGQLPCTLSGGERQRVALGRTLLLHRRVLLLDEPLSNVDVLSRRAIRRYLKRASRQWGTTTVLVTHDQEDAISTSDMVSVLYEGRLFQAGSPQTVFDLPATSVVAEAFGDVQMSWLPIRMAEATQASVSQQEECMIGIRETAFRTSTERLPGYWKAAVRRTEYLGSRTRVFVRLEDCEFTVIVPGVSALTEDDELWVHPEWDRASIYKGGSRVNHDVCL